MTSDRKEEESCDSGCRCGCQVGGGSCIRRNLIYVAVLSGLLLAVFAVLYITR